jgi:hypothetical protein
MAILDEHNNNLRLMHQHTKRGFAAVWASCSQYFCVYYLHAFKMSGQMYFLQ